MAQGVFLLIFENGLRARLSTRKYCPHCVPGGIKHPKARLSYRSLAFEAIAIQRIDVESRGVETSSKNSVFPVRNPQFPLRGP